MDMSMSLSGHRQVMAKLDRLDDVGRGRTMLRAVKSGALPVLNDAKRRAPYRRGNLRRSLHIGAESASARQASVQLGTDIAYGRRQELGFIGTDSLGRSFHQAARPYLRPALESGRGAAEHEITASLQILIREAVG